MYNTNRKDRKYIDVRLKRIAHLNCYFGTDTTEKERNALKREIKPLVDEIKKRDLGFWETTFKIHEAI